MNSIRFRFLFFLAALLLVIVVGTVGFMITEDLAPCDALYFTFVTVGTVGYGDISPQSAAGRVLAVVLIVMGVGTFMGVFANATEMMLNRREQQERLEKLNMVIGAFFSEVGTHLLRGFSEANPNLAALRDKLTITGKWQDADFAAVVASLGKDDCRIDPKAVDLQALRDLLVGKRDFMIRLIENPTLLEHQSFTDLLWAVFHLTEELDARADLASLADNDRLHLSGDMKRAYHHLLLQWLDYMRHLKAKYPYLFSLAMRTNPFDPEARAEVG